MVHGPQPMVYMAGPIVDGVEGTMMAYGPWLMAYMAGPMADMEDQGDDSFWVQGKKAFKRGYGKELACQFYSLALGNPPVETFMSRLLYVQHEPHRELMSWRRPW